MRPVSKRGAARVYGLPVLLVFLGLGLTAAAWQASRLRERHHVEASFATEADELARMLSREIRLFTDVLGSLGQLHTLSDRISVEDFEEFARKGMSHQESVLGAFGFAQRIPDELRASLERPAPGKPAFRLLEMDPASGWRPAEARPEYFPLMYQHPAEALGIPAGFDLASVPDNLSAIARMTLSGRPALGAMTLRRGPPEVTGFLVFAPILGEDLGQTPRELTGLTVSVLWPQEFLIRALGRPRVEGLRVNLFDPSAGAPAPGGNVVMVADREIALADRVWTLRCEALPAYAASLRTPLPAIILAFGVLTSLLLTGLALVMATHTVRVEATVRRRTAELQRANESLAAEMRERERLETEIQEIAAREKQRIGQDLHDSLGQKLTGALFLSRALASQTGAGDSEIRESAAKINEILKEAVSQVRRTARGLVPVDVGHDGLAHALRRLAQETCDVYNIACSFRAADAYPAAGPQEATHLYHIAQEAVNNAVRHAGAREITLRLDAREDGGALTVEDDGRGIPSGAEPSKGSGLRIMRHRARAIGGRLQIASRPGGGTIVTCEFPVEARQRN
jgi:signal transduction histidine kinase